ncbi:MAG: sensor histidine kinase [Planctomycetota bacterium]
MNVVVLAIQRGPIVRAFERELEARGRELALNLAARAGQTAPSGRPDALRDLAEAFLEFEGVQGAQVRSPAGQVGAGTLESGGSALPEMHAAPGTVTILATAGGRDFIARVPGSDAVVRLRLGSRALSDTVSGIGSMIVGIATAAIGAGLLLVFLAAGAIARPIRRLAELARRIREGDLGARSKLRRSDEIGELASAMDTMSVELAEKDRGLRSAIREAEARDRALEDQGRELAIQTRNLETLVTSISEGVLFVGPDRRIDVANPAAASILGIPAGRLRSARLGELRLRGQETRLGALLEEACARADQGERYHSQVYLADHLHTVTTVHDRGGGVLGVLTVIQDLSKIRALEAEQKELLDQLYQQEKMAIVGLLAAGLAHDLNTPLGTILLHTQRVARELEEGADARALEAVVREVHRCRMIVSRLLDFSRIAESRPVEVHLRKPLELAIGLAEASFRHKGISIRKAIATDVPLVWADPNQMEQVVMNLISNAADALPGGGQIDVRLRCADGGAELRVRDEGKGIPPEILGKVFEPFFTTKPRGRGTGLGLAICRRIMEEHRGSIEIRPVREGGTEVRLFLPATEGGHA